MFPQFFVICLTSFGEKETSQQGINLWIRANRLLKVYDRFFLFARLNLPNVLISVAKKIFDSDFPSPCFDVPKASNFTSGGVQNRETENRTLGRMIVTSFQDFKLREKQISQSFSYCELINLLRNGTIVRCLWENKKTSEKSVFLHFVKYQMTTLLLILMKFSTVQKLLKRKISDQK